MNTLLGVRSIDPDYFRAARCLSASPRDVLTDIIIPGALPSIFTGFQIAMGAAWFSLVAGEMIAAQYGLGFMILESYNLVQYPTIIIMMVTLGIVGYASSAAIRLAGKRLMRWRPAPERRGVPEAVIPAMPAGATSWSSRRAGGPIAAVLRRLGTAPPADGAARSGLPVSGG